MKFPKFVGHKCERELSFTDDMDDKLEVLVSEGKRVYITATNVRLHRAEWDKFVKRVNKELTYEA